MRIAKAAIAAAQQHRALTRRRKIGEQRLAVLFVYLRADRHFENDVRAVGAMAVFAHAGPAVLSHEMLLIAVVDQRVKTFDGFRDNIAAFAAVAAIRSAELDKLFAAKRHAAVTAVAGANIDFGFVEKFHRSTFVTGTGWHARLPRWPLS